MDSDYGARSKNKRNNFHLDEFLVGRGGGQVMIEIVITTRNFQKKNKFTGTNDAHILIFNFWCLCVCGVPGSGRNGPKNPEGSGPKVGGKYGLLWGHFVKPGPPPVPPTEPLPWTTAGSQCQWISANPRSALTLHEFVDFRLQVGPQRKCRTQQAFVPRTT